MTRRLILIRHAKSSWDDPEIDDHDRPLTKRGKRGAKAIGAWLAAHEICPGEVIHSSAVRAASTWKKMRKRMSCEVLVRAEPRLYLADPRTMLEVLRGAREAVVMMIGHNPGCAIFAAGMYQAPSAHPDFNRFPTCATCIFDFEIEDWSEVEPGTGEIVDFIAPRQLLG